jgi:hypothetical protein
MTPTRGRPENIREFLRSGISLAKHINQVEFLFYVDYDDDTFPIDVLDENIKIIRGPRLWLSVMQNILFANATGEIIMYTGDDTQFQTQDWDEIVRERFRISEDKIKLVYGNDMGPYGEKIALHGFLHRNWVNAVGCWVAPGRGSLYDLWHTEVARKINRLDYVENLHIAHIHYRQGTATALFDETYKYVYSNSNSWNPKLTYKKLVRERRIDRILLAEIMNPKPKIEIFYAVGEYLAKNRIKFRLTSIVQRRLKSINNIDILVLFAKNAFKILSRKRRLSSKTVL